MTAHLSVLIVGLIAGTVSGVIGTGSSIMLLPVLVLQVGPKRAVPMMAIAALLANIGRVMAWWREVDWRACFAYSVTAVPAAALGARTLLVLPARWVDAALGAFFLLMIPGQRWLRARNFRIGLWQLAIAGAVIGFLTGIVISTGPLSVPAFAAYGLAKGAFLSTEAASALAVFTSKVATFRELGALPLPEILQGVLIGSSVMAGSFIAKCIVQRMSLAVFQHVLEALLLCSGATLMWAALG
jgi:uncharacterized membrane protein YfcA